MTHTYRYDFNAKEHQPELGLNCYDYHARNYNATLGWPGLSVVDGWMNVDPLADEYPSWSPYNYVMNSPLRFTDPTGMYLEEPVYDTKGNHIGNTEEGFTGQVLIYSGDKKIDFSTMSADDAMLMDGVDTYDNQRNALSGDAKSNIWTHIASDMEGKQIYDETFSMSTLTDGEVKYRNIKKGAWGFLSVKQEKGKEHC